MPAAVACQIPTRHASLGICFRVLYLMLDIRRFDRLSDQLYPVAEPVEATFV